MFSKDTSRQTYCNLFVIFRAAGLGTRSAKREFFLPNFGTSWLPPTINEDFKNGGRSRWPTFPRPPPSSPASRRTSSAWCCCCCCRWRDEREQLRQHTARGPHKLCTTTTTRETSHSSRLGPRRTSSELSRKTETKLASWIFCKKAGPIWQAIYVYLRYMTRNLCLYIKPFHPDCKTIFSQIFYISS